MFVYNAFASLMLWFIFRGVSKLYVRKL